MAGLTLVDRIRCYMLHQLALSVLKKFQDREDVNIAEVGVYKGGTALLLAETMKGFPKSSLYLFDTFEGMPPCDPKRDLHKEGNFKDTSIQAVMVLLKEYRNVQIIKGFFPRSAYAHDLTQHGDMRFAFAHIDCDIYTSVMDSCGFFGPRMVPGGIMVFDDYGFPSCPGAKQAVDNFFGGWKYGRPVYLPTGQCFVQF